MARARLKLTRIGPIKEGELAFGDLTLLVGPQASGKTIALQILKLILDAGYIQHTMVRYGLNWSKELPSFLDLYFGEGMRGIWDGAESQVEWNEKTQDLTKWAAWRRRERPERLFFIPAQRVLTLRDGWPRPFSDYSPSDPFVVRDFSEKLRLLLEGVRGGKVFPQTGRLKAGFRSLLERSVFGKFGLEVDHQQAKKRLVLVRSTKQREQRAPLPFMVWSAGQREFVPLLLGLYHLLPPSKVSRRDEIKWVVIEEPETGLHARAVSDVLLLILELVGRGYQTCVSTHSPQILEAIWALRHLKQNNADPRCVLRLFGVEVTTGRQQILEVAKRAMDTRKRINVYYFKAPEGQICDISDLDPASEEAGEGGWGGLVEFSSRANREVAAAVAGQEQDQEQETEE